MIEAKLGASLENIATRLARKAAALAEASVSRRKLGADSPARWRDARLLWPLFTKD